MIDPIVFHPELHAKQEGRPLWPWRGGRWARPVFTLREALKRETGGH